MTPTSSTNGVHPAAEPIAIVGLGCVLPDAPNVAAFWENLCAGRSSIREVPKERWDPDLYWSEDRRAMDKTYSKIGSFVTGFQPDWRRFRLLPRALEQIDESQLWALEATAQALADAGYNTKAFDRSRTAVIFGNSGGGEIRVANSIRIYFAYAAQALRRTPSFQALAPEEQARILGAWETIYKDGLPDLNEDTLIGELSNVIAGRVANTFDLRGKSLTADAACASSIAALDVAVRTLQAHESEVVVLGASDHFQEPSLYVKFCRVGALSATGSRPFDASADGFVMGEGCAVMILKRLADAERDGDRVYAVIRGLGATSDGAGRGLTAPKSEGQVEAIRRALESAHTSPSEVQYVECHGTGTTVGDAAEIASLRAAFPERTPDEPLLIGSVKSNLGHLKSAAGMAALLKLVLSIHHGRIPPSLGIENPNPVLAGPGTRIEPVRRARTWPAAATEVRLAGLSSFGFGGTNYHLVLSSYATRVQGAPPLAVAEPGGHAPDPTLVGRLRTVASATLGQVQPNLAMLTPFERLELVAAVRHEFGIQADARLRPADCESWDLLTARVAALLRDQRPAVAQRLS